jgi:hypothetical protein
MLFLFRKILFVIFLLSCRSDQFPRNQINLDKLVQDLGYLDKKMNNYQNKTSNFTLDSMQPTHILLENMLTMIATFQVVNSNESHGNILPSYEGVHGVMIHDNENFKHEFNHTTENKSADFADYMKWLENERSVNKLDRFKQLYNELSFIEKNKLYLSEKTSDKELEILSKRLFSIIKQMEREEMRKKVKNDL